MNLYSNKQTWKIVLLIVALITVAASLWVSNSTVQKVSDRERLRAKQWADAIKKKAELVEFTNRAFQQLRGYERRKIKLYLDATKEISKEPTNGNFFPDYRFPISIINENKDIPVILVDDENQVSGFINLDFDTTDLRTLNPTLTRKELTQKYEDSLLILTTFWEKNHKPFRIEVVKGLTMTYFYTDTKRTIELEKERDSLISAFNNELINDSKLIPVVLMNKENDSLISSNLSKEKTNLKNLRNTLRKLELVNDPIEISFGENQVNLLYFDNSDELKQLQFFPYIQFLIIGLFILIGYLLFSTFRKAEQNQVWAGMAKETAHQMGTPLSSLMAWIQILETQDVDQSIIAEMQKDVERLDTVSQRFSKIGSETQLTQSDIRLTVQGVMDYLRPRISQKVEMTTHFDDEEILVSHNKSLMEWVMENIIRNAVDAMESKGKLDVTIKTVPERVYIEISDTGKGLLPKQFKSIFEPGYTTKKRGWGLGLSLVKRIVKEYHKGKVYVVHSEIGKGTMIRVSLPLK
ncbi:sensor histidine kinase [Fluviicola taffensis]|uniref:histidine kinase n=1 Tax=Fluviicola taffensis (strain DSM 16823 / NCIMB 13979 / RW262) TaxID=755732 RepID=F2IE67_FLUTR|nr:ATP-binding protein [Fluviicola taffensis]AEA42385.1 integral membrane sensor signal transduction histidine kinase [Fluviicola taffensis DSM 16823]